MNRTQFLMALYDALEGLSADERADAVSEYREYFRIEMEKGRTEEEIAQSLGDLVALAYAIKSRRGFRQYSEPTVGKSGKRPFSKPALWVIIAILIVMSMSGIGAAVNFAKGFKWDINIGFGTRYEVNDIKEVDLSQAGTIRIKTSIASTNITASNSKQVKAQLKGNLRTTSKDGVPYLEVSRSGDTIVIEEKRKTTLAGCFASNIMLEINIPDDFKGDIDFEGSSGNVSASGLKINSLKWSLSSGNMTLDHIILDNDLNLSSSSGNIRISGIQARDATIKSNSGVKEFIDFSVLEDIMIRSSSGSTEVDNVRCSDMVLECTSGTVRVNKCKAKFLTIESSSGGTTVTELEGSARIKARSGNINVTVSKPGDELTISASSGNIRLRMPEDAGFTLDSRVSSGSIHCSFELKDKDSGKKSLRGTYRNGATDVKISANSGSINIEH